MEDRFSIDGLDEYLGGPNGSDDEVEIVNGSFLNPALPNDFHDFFAFSDFLTTAAAATTSNGQRLPALVLTGGADQCGGVITIGVAVLACVMLIHVRVRGGRKWVCWVPVPPRAHWPLS